MFDIKSLSGVKIRGFTVTLPTGASTNAVSGVLLTLNGPGSFVGHETERRDWLPARNFYQPLSSGSGSFYVGISPPLELPPGTTQAFYIFLNSGDQQFSIGTTGIGSVFLANADIELHTGIGGGPNTLFNLPTAPVNWHGGIHYEPLQNFNDDVRLDRITAPAHDGIGCPSLTTTETVSVLIRNTGFNVIPAGTVMNISYQLDGGVPVMESLVTTTSVDSWDTIPFNFATLADFSGSGQHSLTATVSYIGDADLANDVLTESIGNGGQDLITSFPYVGHFPTMVFYTSYLFPPLPTGFVNETGDASGPNSDWRTRTKTPPWAATSAIPAVFDHTTGFSNNGSAYAYIDSHSSHSAVNLRSPCFDLTNVVSPELSFFLHSLNSAAPGPANNLSVDVQVFPSGALTTDVFGPEGGTGQGWVQRTVDLSAFAGQRIQLVFRGQTDVAPWGSNDIAIDDIRIEDSSLVNGQKPRPGLSVLDINNPKNINNNPLSSGKGGPYFTQIAAGGTLTFKMLGEPTKPIVLFSGPLKAVAASFANIGSIDLGGPIDPLSGIPTALTLVGDGFSPGPWNSFFMTNHIGDLTLGFTVPNLPSGIFGSFQFAIGTTAPFGLALSNAVQVTIQ